MTENKEQKEDMIGGDEIAVVPANEEIADTLLPKRRKKKTKLIVKFRKPLDSRTTRSPLGLPRLEDRPVVR